VGPWLTRLAISQEIDTVVAPLQSVKLGT
jgi:hypothetical protein